ncbi:DUF3307 domain-containing protein [Glaciecola sp. MF2-115]|uniref:DUF3307 domain-containing protein n=1 Tax=Glaciecola sp. MF2-115 TaxID=3384827 RepID=UPI0039A2F835
MKLFFFLLVAHFIADFYLQKYTWIMCKVENKERSIGLFKHMLVHLALTSAAILLSGVALDYKALLALLIIISSHYLIDIWKTYRQFVLKYFLIDQVAHILFIVAVTLWLNEVKFQNVLADLQAFFDAKTLMLLGAYLFLCKPVSLLITLSLTKYTEQFNESEKANEGLASAGESIGYFERGLIASFILLDQFAGVGFLLAAKSVFRFGDMRRQSDRKLTEYIMLGTLFSFSFGIAVGKLADYLLTVL